MMMMIISKYRLADLMRKLITRIVISMVNYLPSSVSEQLIVKEKERQELR